MADTHDVDTQITAERKIQFRTNASLLGKDRPPRDSFVPGDSLPVSVTSSAARANPKSVLVLAPDLVRYRRLTSSFKPLGLSAYQISNWKQLRMILHERIGQHRLVIIDGYTVNRNAQEMVYALRAIDPHISILMLDMLTKKTQKKLERYGGILTTRANPIRPTIKLAIGRLLAHHHTLEQLRVDEHALDAFQA